LIPRLRAWLLWPGYSGRALHCTMKFWSFVISSMYYGAIRRLIHEMSVANPLWGAPRIHGELLKLGIDVGQTTVAKYMGERRTPRLHKDHFGGEVAGFDQPKDITLLSRSSCLSGPELKPMPRATSFTPKRPRALSRLLFLKSLGKDLAAVGFRVRKPRGENDSWRFVPPDYGEQSVHLRGLRAKQIYKSRDFIQRMESDGMLTLLGDGRSIDPVRICPQIKFCRTSADHDVFRYGKLFQKVPTTNRVGRQIRCLVYDVGQRSPCLMGVFELTSGAYTLGCRDDYLGWSGLSRKTIKDKGLRRIMDLASLISLPPYNLLFGGKLIAALAFSDIVLREVRRRYRSELLGVVATSATGLHCAILNRIGLRSGGLFRRIGQTSGYSTLFASQSTLSLARRFLADFVSAPEGEFSSSVRPLHVLRVAMRACGVSPEQILRSAYPKGVYFATIADDHVRALRTGETCRHQGLPTERIVEYWKARYLSKALADPNKFGKFVAYRSYGP
jgi:hypothetical protein